jgi:hypothetical protein
VRAAAIHLSVALAFAGEIARAQGVSDPSMLRGCLLKEPGERLECLDKLSRSSAPPSQGAPTTGNWTVSETTSPVDYTPIVVATTPSRGGAENSAMQLTVYCRNGRTELVIAGPSISGRGEDYAISYRVNGDEPVHASAGAPSFGTGAAFKGDVVRLLQTLPEAGDIAIRLAPRTGAAREGNFSLGGLKPVRDKLAGACKWPQAIAKPRN